MSFNSFCFIHSQQGEDHKTFFEKLKPENKEKYNFPDMANVCIKKLFLRNYRDKAKVTFQHSWNEVYKK